MSSHLVHRWTCNRTVTHCNSTTSHSLLKHNQIVRDNRVPVQRWCVAAASAWYPDHHHAHVITPLIAYPLFKPARAFAHSRHDLNFTGSCGYPHKVLYLVDGSLPTRPMDLKCIEWLVSGEVPLSVVFTKVDKRLKGAARRSEGGPIAMLSQAISEHCTLGVEHCDFCSMRSSYRCTQDRKVGTEDTETGA